MNTINNKQTAVEKPYALYSDGDCISEHDTLEDAEKAFNKEIVDNDLNNVNVLSADGTITYLSYDPDTEEVYRDEQHL